LHDASTVADQLLEKIGQLDVRAALDAAMLQSGLIDTLFDDLEAAMVAELAEHGTRELHIEKQPPELVYIRVDDMTE
jgi:hypothetical protein